MTTTSGTDTRTSTAKGHYADVNGIHLYYEIHGEGRPLVLLHGGLGSTDMFGPVIPALAQHHRVIGVDLQGHGRTADIDREISVFHLADDVAALIAHLGVGPCDVMGYSLGGGVALQTAIRHPDAVRRLVVCSVPFRRDAFWPDILAQQAFVNADAAEMFKQTRMWEQYRAIAPRPEDFPRLLDKIGAAMKVDFDFTDEIRALTLPVLVVAADSDIFPVSHAVEMFKLLGGAQRDGNWDGSGRPRSALAVIPRRTHYDAFLDPMLAEVATRFLQEA